MALLTHHHLKILQLSQFQEHCLRFQLGAMTSKLSKLRYTINPQKSGTIAQYHYVNFDKNKNHHFRRHKNEQKSRVLTFSFFIENSVAKPKVSLHSKIQTQSQVRSKFFLSSLMPGPSYSHSFQCILAFPRFSTSSPHCMPGNSQIFRQGTFPTIHLIHLL